jgi:hypothetical protein
MSNWSEMADMMLFSDKIRVERAAQLAKAEIAALNLAMTRKAAAGNGVADAELLKAKEDLGMLNS